MNKIYFITIFIKKFPLIFNLNVLLKKICCVKCSQTTKYTFSKTFQLFCATNAFFQHILIQQWNIYRILLYLHHISWRKKNLLPLMKVFKLYSLNKLTFAHIIWWFFKNIFGFGPILPSKFSSVWATFCVFNS